MNTSISTRLCSRYKHNTAKFFESHKSHVIFQLPINSRGWGGGGGVTCEIWNKMYSTAVYHNQWISAAHPHTTWFSGCFYTPRPLSLHLVHMQSFLLVSASHSKHSFGQRGAGRSVQTQIYMLMTHETSASCASHNCRSTQKNSRNLRRFLVYATSAEHSLHLSISILCRKASLFYYAKAVWLSATGTVMWTGRRNAHLFIKPKF